MDDKISNDETKTISEEELMKKIVRDISKEEAKENNVNVAVYPLTIIEYFQEGMFKNNLKLLKDPISAALLPLVAEGYNISNEDTIVVFLNSIKKIKKIEKKFFRLAQICYHELWHQKQKEFDDFSYNGFLRNMDAIQRWYSNFDYLVEHSKYSVEIGANIYSIQKAKEYLKKNYPELYEREKEYIEKKEQLYLFYYKTYDAADNVDFLIKILNKKKNYLEKNKGKEHIELYEKHLLPILNIFFTKDFIPKKIKDIINHSNFNKLDKKIIYAILSSKTFLESINFEQLTEEELSLLLESLTYTKEVYKNQLKTFCEENEITLKAFLKMEKNILKKILMLDSHFFTPKIKHLMNMHRSDRTKKVHRESIPKYLEKTTTSISMKRRGYITFDIFYIVGIVLSILTILYLLF